MPAGESRAPPLSLPDPCDVGSFSFGGARTSAGLCGSKLAQPSLRFHPSNDGKADRNILVTFAPSSPLASLPQRQGHQFALAAGAGFGVEAGELAAHSAHAQVQAFGDGLGGQAPQQQFQYPQFGGADVARVGECGQV